MTSSRCSKATALALLAVLVLAAVSMPAAAVSVSEESFPEEAAAGSTVEATVTLTDLYQNPEFKRWALVGETQLENVTWLVELRNLQGNTVATRQYNTTSFNLSGISTESQYGAISEVSVTVRGVAPTVNEYTWPEEETFVVMKLGQRAGASGSNPIDTWRAHHYTTGTEDDPGTREVRSALNDARSAIDSAREADADVSSANSTLQNAVSAYENGNFGNALDLAQKAQTEAEDAEARANRSAQTTQLLLFGGGGLVVLLAIGGGVWYWRNQQEEYDKLG